MNLEDIARPMSVGEVRAKLDAEVQKIGTPKLGPFARAFIGVCCVAIAGQTRVIAARARRKIRLLKAMGMMAALLLLTAPASANCFATDVRVYCCPAACAVKKSPKWERANDVLRGCMRGLGCEQSDNATVFMKCGC